jgi:hypothetical protein
VRTTLSLDDDIANLLSQEIRRSGVSFKEAVNHYLRLGLTAAKQPARKKFVVKPLAVGLPPGLSYDHVEELIEVLEGPLHQ